MSAACIDVDTAPLSDSGRDARGFQGVLKAFGGEFLRGHAIKVLCGVERDEVHVCVDSLKQLRDALGMVKGVVGAVNQSPGEEDALTGETVVSAAGGHEFGKWPALVGGQERGAFFLGGCVEADSEVVRAFFFRHAQNSGDNAYGTHADPAGADVEAACIAENFEGRHHRVIVMKRFAHSHQN